ncbi:unnamed protein product [Medioppia subpectinata]|uniref:BOS complex subunit TMEM147 n=1 Tax=Medioppia subpectinata TaxID=1979941 RepID=A0A7R9L2F7_9ACAR|nr:unnamed protein product [Medioppia subpectinata]CAG2114099.1 unnamed protein product [Medioppia subpectinata]
MTFYHFINCLFLTFTPIVLLYKFSSLSEYGTIWRTGVGVLAYIVTQVCKLVIIAAVIPPNPLLNHLIDLLGMYWFLVNQNKASIASVKILSIALGWSLGESIFTRLVDFYLNARSLQFDASHLLSATEANIHLVKPGGLCAVVAVEQKWQQVVNCLNNGILCVFVIN